MSVVLGVFIALGVLAVTAMTAMVFVAERRGFRAAFRLLPPERRRVAAIAGAGTLLYIVGGSVLLIASPWGPATFLVLFGAAALVLIAATVWSAASGSRRGS